MAKTTKNSRNYGVAKAVLTFMTSNADRPITASEIAEATGFIENSINGALQRLVERYPNVRRPQKGVYMWDSVAKEKPQNEILVQVIDRKPDGSGMLVRDEENGRAYVMKPVEY